MCTKTLEGRFVLQDVKPRVNEVVLDEVGDAFVGVDLGFQPSTPRSHGGRGEIEKDRLVLGFGLRESRVCIVKPRNIRHEDTPSKILNQGSRSSNALPLPPSKGTEVCS